MKKLSFLLMVVNIYAFTPVCNVFSDVLQTRNTGSKIIPNSGATSNMYDSSCVVNTTAILNNSNNHTEILCNSKDATASGNLGSKLSINYSFNVESANVDKKPFSFWWGNYDKKITSNNQILNNANYNTITQDWHNYSFSLTYNGDKKINNFKDILNNVTIDKMEDNDLYIGYFTTKGWSNTNLILKGTAHNIEIYQLQSSGSNKFSTSLNAKNYIKIHELNLNSSQDDTIIIKAPKVVIDKLNGGNNYTNIKIYANNIDIGSINLAQYNQIEIHPYTPSANVTFHSNSITASSSSTLILDSGNYYTKSFSVPGTSSSSSIRAYDNNQIVNFYIDGDFKPGNNPGINSDGNNAKFGTLPPLNFRMFINGDLQTGGGGTTFNALVYVEGKADLGSPTYLKGALSAGNDISAGNGSKFYYDSSILDSAFGICKIPLKFDNNYSCSIFPTVLTAYDTLTLSSNDIFNTCDLSTNHYIETGNATCRACGNCNIIDIPKNKYNHTMLETSKTNSNTINSDTIFNEKEYGNYLFNKSNQNITLSPTKTYDDNPTKLMLFGNVKFDKPQQTLNLDEGDYYFKSFISTSSHFKMCPNGNVRIFVKNNFELNGDNIDTNCGNGHIFVYTTKDAIIGHNGGGNTDLHLYIYAKRNVIVNNNANASDIYGAITAENNITVNGNNVNFHYENNYLNDFGIGKCKLCYDENYVSQDGFKMFMFSACTPFTPCKFDMPIRNVDSNTLDSVKVTETYKKSSTIAMDFFGMKADTIDKDGNHVGNGATTNKSSNYSFFNIIDLGLNSESTTYDFGNNYPTYEPNKNYYRAYRSSTLSFSINLNPKDMFSQWKDSVVYLAEYNADGKHYAIRIDACPYINDSTNKKPTGFLDAWDDYNTSRGLNDRNISTKIVNKPFNLTIAYIPTGYKVNTSSADVEYYLKDINNNAILSTKNILTIPSNTYIHTIHTYKINKAYKNVKVEFKVCANYDSYGYVLYPLATCKHKDTCNSNTTKNKICYRYFQNSDAFAIRPNSFKITGNGINRADNNISFISIKALDYANNETNNYNEESNNLNIKANDINPSCNVATPTYNFTFKNGLANIDYIKYPEVGDIKLILSEKVGKEFAIVDEDDTLDNDRLISEGTSPNFAVLPDHFSIYNLNLQNFNNGSFTYLSKDLEMSSILQAIIEAQNANNQITHNYSSNCYAKKLDVNITHSSDTSMNHLNNILTQYSSTPKNNPISFTLNENNFTNGDANLNLKINFDRSPNRNYEVNPFTLTLNNISVEDENHTIGVANINQSTKFIYGRVVTEDKTTIDNEVNLTIKFEDYNGFEWKINTAHNNKIYGDVNSTYTSANVNIILNESLIHNGIQDITISPNVNTRPYKVKLHLNIPTWLWYSLYNMVYASPNSNNTKCSTHPCDNVLFLKSGNKGWAGAGTNENDNNVTKNTINSKIKQNTKKNNNFHKISW